MNLFATTHTDYVLTKQTNTQKANVRVANIY